MAGEAYRDSPYRVEERIRPLTADEEARVQEEDARFRKAAELDEPTLLRDFLTGLPLLVAIIVLGIWRKSAAAAVIGIVMLLVGGLFARQARRAERARRVKPKNIWAPPSGGWKVRETTVVARSMVTAATNDEDYLMYFLYEIPGGDWFYLVSDLTDGADPDRAQIRLVALHPDGPRLALESTGEPIPRHGEENDSEGQGYAKSVERGFVWRPRSGRTGTGDGRLPERRVPKWARKLVGTRSG